MLPDTAAFEEFEELQQDYNNACSNNRDRMVKEVQALNLSRPGCNKHK
jgi:hypothetical protein